MSGSWQDEKLDPEKIVILLERERRAWIEAANGFEEIKGSLAGSVAVQKATHHVYACRARAEALKRSVARLCEQFKLPGSPEDH